MKKAILAVISVIAIIASGCSSDTGGKASGDDNKLTIAWLPNESGADLGEAREEIGKVIEKKTGKKVEHQTTTDYIIAIEAIANGNADMAFLGAQGYIEANKKNNNVQPLVVPSGESGTLDDAVYYSWLSVRKGEEEKYKQGGSFTLDNIAGKKFSFVSNSSTSGFKVPSTGIVDYFSKMEKYKGLTAKDLLEGGKDQFFKEVLFGGSHQGSAVNLLTGKADVAAFCDTCVGNYVNLTEGEKNKPGAVYQVKEKAEEPFHAFPGEEFTVISSTPVLNSPFVVNMDNINKEEQEQLLKALTSKEVAENEKVFVPEESEFSGLFTKTSGKEQLVQVGDAWFDPIRKMSK